jgi:formylglycine-generating enzyme required for sulfatase activity
VLVLVPAGEFIMGSNAGEGDDGEQPRHKVYLRAYYIGKYEVTNGQFARFLQETGYGEKGGWEACFESGRENHPVVGVSWKDASAYCRWAGLRLPTEAEWEKAARGTDGRFFPWKGTWDGTRCNFDACSRGTTPVGSYPRGISPYGAMDMTGNAWEWCADWYGGYVSGRSSNPRGPLFGSVRVLRGGSWGDAGTRSFHCSARRGLNPDLRLKFNGFRVCRSLDAR